LSALAELVLADDAEAWRAGGFSVGADDTCVIGTVTLRFVEPKAGEKGIRSWGIAGAPDESVTNIDGLVTTHVEPSPIEPVHHPLGVRSIDHIVVMTPNIERTTGAVERCLGVPLRRTRDGETTGRAIRQTFFRLGEVILEIVGPPEPDPEAGPAQFWGLALTVDSIKHAEHVLGAERLGPSRPAVQPGRSIATVRSAAGFRVPVALMSAD
jgi:Glyoxalase/Bleomycin resistance protein/Dioxygenase superfamily